MSTTSTPVTEGVNAYLQEHFNSEDDFLRSLNQEALDVGIPAINIAPEQTRFLQVMLTAIQANNVLEIGSLAGYSAIAMARVLPEDGRLYACEVNVDHAAFIRKKVNEASLQNVITVVEGLALDTLPTVFADLAERPTPLLDAVFIDADKTNYANYLQAVLPYMRKGGLVIADNAMAFGHLVTVPPDNELEGVMAIRHFNLLMSTHTQLLSTLVPLGDGMVIGVVR